VFAVSGFVFLLGLFIGLRALKWQPSLRDYSMRLTRPAPRWLGLLPLLALLALVLKPIHWQDDLAALSPVPAELLAQDGQLRSWFQQPQVDQLLLVSGANTQAVLQRLEQLTPAFVALQAQGVLGASLSVADWLPSAQRQAQRQHDLPTRVEIMHALETLDLPFRASHFAALLADLEQTRTADILTPAQFEPLAMAWQQAVLPFLLAEREGESVARILLFNVQDANALADWAQNQGLELFVQRTFIQTQVAELRVTLLSVLSGMIAVFILALALIYRQPVVWGRMAFSLLLTALTTVGLLHAFLPALSVFHLVALLLVMAISVDYAVFIEQAKRTSASLLSVNTALITSLLTFGLLLFTPVPLLEAMGQTLVVGVLSAYWITRWVHRH
jgi:predicted exporter